MTKRERDPDRFLTPPEIARKLGIGPAKVYLMIESGELMAIDVASPGSRRRQWRIADEWLEAWMKTRMLVKPERATRQPKPIRPAAFTKYFQ